MIVFLLWLSFLLFFHPSSSNSLSASLSHFPSLPLCHPHESSALLKFKYSCTLRNDSSYYSQCLFEPGTANPNSSMYWDKGRDCCTWRGVTCDDFTGHVISLDLKCGGFQSIIHSSNSLFLLSYLQNLILDYNHFHGSEQSPQFGRYVSMIYLDFTSSRLIGQVPLEFSSLSSLVTLDLSLNYHLRLETFSLKQIVANLTRLKELFLHDVNMSFVSPHSFTNLSATLTCLDLSNSGLKGEFPENIFHLPRLQKLDLSYNWNLTGSIPRYNWSSPLKYLNLSGTRFLIDLPYLTKSLKSLNSLFVSSCRFKGSYPAFLSNLTHITSLGLADNSFDGQIPWSSLNLGRLIYLDLSVNNFIGQLPEICSNSTKVVLLCDTTKHQPVGTLPLNLKTLDLSGNLLNGTIPSWLYSLPSLQRLDLSGNQFTGYIQEFQFTSLVSLSLTSNKLRGLIPRSIFRQVNLTVLDLSSNNLSGVVQFYQFSKLKNLRFIDLSFNSLSEDSTNSIISVLPNTLQLLFLSSCGMSEFPHSLGGFENLEYLDLSNNQIEGRVPQWFWNIGKDSLGYLNLSHNLLTHMEKIPWKRIRYIDLSSNRFQGHLPTPPPSTVIFSVSNNQFVGEISSLLCSLNSFDVLDLSNNILSGNIPPCFGNFNHLKLSTVTDGNSLRILNLHGNQLEGSLPKSLLNCKNLEILDIGNNKLNGSFPYWLEALPKLQVLILTSNRFQGPISNPKAKSPFQKLRILDASNNEFTGLLPGEYFENFRAMMNARTDVLEYMGEYLPGGSYYSVTMPIKGISIELAKIQKMFMTLDFSSNYFTGQIPHVIGMLNSLKGLNFSYNHLFGFIPPSLGKLSNLEWLDLSSNKLSGSIPLQLAADLNQLANLNLSDNKLEGRIPRGTQFDTFTSDSYNGNPGLCGFPLPKSYTNEEAQAQDDGDDDDDDDGEQNTRLIDWTVVKMGYGSGIVIGISVGYMVLFSGSFDY